MNLSKLLLFLLSFWLTSCFNGELQTDGTYFFLRSAGADMPVWVKGNTQSDVFILFLHGGPGGTAHEYVKNPAFSRLEQRYRMVYWDQRASGLSQGNPLPESMTLSQFVTDLDKVVDLLRSKYNQPKIYLMGHSWGGALGTAYLADGRHQAKIRGWINVDGSYYERGAILLSRQFVIDYANRAIIEGREVAFWQDALNWYQANPPYTTDQDHHYQLLDRANGNVYRPQADSTTVPYVQLALRSPFSLAALQSSPLLAGLRDEFIQLDLRPQLKTLELPTLILWGKYDGNEPVAQAEELYRLLGTPVKDKYLTIFAESAHSPMDEEPFQFASEVIRFINRYP